MRSGSSYEEIAADLGYASRASAWRLVNNGLKSAVDDIAEDYLRMELERLDALQVGIWHCAIGGDIPSVNVVLRIIAQRVRLVGAGQVEVGIAAHPVVNVGAHSEHIRNEGTQPRG